MVETALMTRDRTKPRKVERIQLGIPILAKANNVDVVMMDFSLRGARLESHVPFKVNSELKIHFDWGDEQVNLDSDVVRCKIDITSEGKIYNTGVLFNTDTKEAAKLREIISRQLERALEEQKANARGELAEILEHMPIFSIGGTLTANPKQVAEAYEGKSALLPWTRIARRRGYVKFALENERWRKIRTSDPTQPMEGFTVWAYEDEDHLEKLKRVYQNSDDETRSLIRMCAELSLNADDSLPPQRFNP